MADGASEELKICVGAPSLEYVEVRVGQEVFLMKLVDILQPSGLCTQTIIVIEINE